MIEAAPLSHPAVAECNISGKPDPEQGAVDLQCRSSAKVSGRNHADSRSGHINFTDTE